MSSVIDVHADDYAYSLNTSKDMLECMKVGKLDSFSIICNTVSFEESMELLYDSIPDLPFLPKISVHLNFPEGKGITGLLPISWGKLFLASYGLSYDKTKTLLKKEIAWQIETTQNAIGKCIEIAKNNNIPCDQEGIRIDSHIHTHPLPVVWNALTEVISEQNYKIEFIRNPKEPLWPFLQNTTLLSTFGFTNLIKNRILMLYSGKIDRFCETNKLDKMYMWGLMMSGHMDYDRIRIIYPSMNKLCKSRNRKIEILFHPGMASQDEYSPEMDPNYFRESNLSENRHVEKNAVMKMKEIKEEE